MRRQTVFTLVFLAALAAYFAFRDDRSDGPLPEPWVVLFDGETLDGWVTTGGRYDGNARWSVEDGTITGREGPDHAGGLLYTKDAYRNFEIELAVFVATPFDSGIFLRMRPEARGYQVTLDDRPGGEIAGIYADGWLQHTPLGRQGWRENEWNRVRVRCVGDPVRITVSISGIIAAEYEAPEDTTGFAKEGLIGLQVHGARDDPAGSKVMFKDIRIQKIH